MSNYIYSNYNLNEIFMREKIQQAHEKKIQKIKENTKEAKNTFVNERNQNNFQLKKIRKINFEFHQKEKQQEINRCNQKLLQKLLDISMRNPIKRVKLTSKQKSSQLLFKKSTPFNERDQSQDQNQTEQSPNKNVVTDQDKINNKNDNTTQNSESPDTQNQQYQKSIVRQHKFYMKTKHKNEEIHQQNIKIAQRIIGQQQYNCQLNLQTQQFTYKRSPIVIKNQKLYEDYKRQQEFKNRIARYETDGSQVKLKKVGDVTSKISLIRNSASPTLRQTQNKFCNTENSQPANQRLNTQQSPSCKLQTASNSERMYIIKSPIRNDKTIKRNSSNDALEQLNSSQSSKSNINLPPAIAQIKFNNSKTIIRQNSPSFKKQEQNVNSTEIQQQTQPSQQQLPQILHKQLHTQQNLSQTQQQKKLIETNNLNKSNDMLSSPKKSSKKLSQSEQKLNQSGSEINEDQNYYQDDFDDFSSLCTNKYEQPVVSKNQEAVQKQITESQYYSSISQHEEKDEYQDDYQQSQFSLSKE